MDFMWVVIAVVAYFTITECVSLIFQKEAPTIRTEHTPFVNGSTLIYEDKTADACRKLTVHITHFASLSVEEIDGIRGECDKFMRGESFAFDDYPSVEAILFEQRTKSSSVDVPMSGTV